MRRIVNVSQWLNSVQAANTATKTSEAEDWEGTGGRPAQVVWWKHRRICEGKRIENYVKVRPEEYVKVRLEEYVKVRLEENVMVRV